MDLVHCIYCSSSTKSELSKDELLTLLDECRRKNAKAGITGLLLYQSGSFFQVLEGERSVIEPLFETISRDPRHHRALKIILEPIAARAFGNWSMGFPQLSHLELAKIPGLSDFFRNRRSFLEIGEGRAKTLLKAFREGRWRTTIT